MKRGALSIAALVALAVLAGCSLSVSPPSQRASGITPLPADTVADVSRSFGGAFEYETVLPVDLKLHVVVYDGTGASSAPGDGSVVVAEIHDSKGRPVYAGRLQPDGTLEARLQLAAAQEDMTLTLGGAGFEGRSILIPRMVRYSEVNRTVGILFDAGVARAAADLTTDSDGDGVPDVYDAFPTDPDAAFAYQTPANGKLTVAFEDLFGQARAGDADYNDFIAKYTVQEIADGSNAVTKIIVNAEADTKLAGYHHKFGIRIDKFEGKAILSGSYVDGAGTSRKLGPVKTTGPLNVVLFEDSRTAVGKKASFTLEFATPQLITPRAGTVDRPPYNPYLYVYDTGKEIHLMGEQDTRGSTSESYQDAEGFPWALLVPSDWVHPAEGQRIEIPYPRFTSWRESFGQKDTDWYLPAQNVNHAPYPVYKGWIAAAPGETDGTANTAPSFTKTGAPRYYQLLIQEIGGLKDPDGDQVFFRSSTLPGYMTLDADTGLVTIINAAIGTQVISFWSEDAQGASTSGTPYTVTFKFTGS
jgi:LruC domain-containing protein